MSEFVLKRERFKFGIFDQAPTVQNDECILLYQERHGENGSMVIDSINKPFTSDIRRGKFNMKVSFSLKERTYSDAMDLEIADYGFYFQVSIYISYAIKNVREYYFRDHAESEELVKKDIRRILMENDKKWDLHDGNELERTLRRELEICLQGCRSLKFNNIGIKVTPDTDAERMIKSDKEKDVNIYTHGNETDVELARKENEGRILDRDHVLKMKKANQLTELVEIFGELAPIVSEHLDEKMDGRELYKYIEEKRERNLEFLLEAGEKDIIDDQKMDQILNGVIGKGNFVQMKEEKQIEGKPVEQIEKKSKEEKLVEDGDYL